jgi:hypothetical protein
MKQDVDAKQYYSTAIQIDGNSKDAYLRRGCLFFKNRHFTSSLADYSKVFEMETTLAPIALKGRIASNIMLGNIAQVSKDMEMMETLNPGDKFTLHVRNFLNTYSETAQSGNADIFRILNQELNTVF